MIEAKSLCAGYDKTERLHRIDLTMKSGEITVIVGPNGCGKSTLLKALSGLAPITGGSVALCGRALESYPPRELAQTLAILPQSRNIPAISVRRMVLHGRFPYLSYPRRYRAEDYSVCDEMLAAVGMEQFAQRQMSALSGGERQKVYLAMALAQQTPVVLLDEPTTFLDVRHQLEVIALAQSLAGMGKTVGMVLHDLNLALRCAHRVVVMDEGRVYAHGGPDEVASSGALDRVFGVHTQLCHNKQGERYYAFAQDKGGENKDE